MEINWFGFYLLVLGIWCLFFPVLIIFGYGAEGFDWFVVSFLIFLCLFLIIPIISILFNNYEQDFEALEKAIKKSKELREKNKE